jgi:hypothetical protein
LATLGDLTQIGSLYNGRESPINRVLDGSTYPS